MTDYPDGIDENAFSPILQLATALHEMFNALMSSGFSENQALYITSKMVIREDDFDDMTDDTDR